MTTPGLKLQRTIPLLSLVDDLAVFGEEGETGLVIDREAWQVAGEPIVVTVTVEKVR